MPSPASIQSFLDTLTASGLVSAEKLAEILDAWPTDMPRTDARQVARELVRCGLLTEFQASAIYQGRTKGLVFGEYIVLEMLGVGGMGRVFRAVHRRMDRIVALKVLPKEALASADAVERFHREVRAAAKLLHPNIAAAYDAGDRDGIHYLVMEYVDGEDLARYVQLHGPLPLAKAVDCVLQTARGLGYAHSHGVVHRDIKPANLLLSSDGVVKILDMGLARFDSPQLKSENETMADEITRTGQVIGTLDYMAPEQAEDITKADHRSDIYSLGCVLYRLVIGKIPYPADTALKKVIAHRESPIPVISNSIEPVSQEINAILRKMLAKKPADRFQSASELIEGLKPLTEPDGIGILSLTDRTKAKNSDDDVSRFLRTLESDVGVRGHAERNENSPIALHGKVSRRDNIALPGRPTRDQPVPVVRRTWLLMAFAILLLIPLIAALANWTRSAKLKIDWPPAERRGARVLIDNAPQPLPVSGEVVYRLTPGRHRVVLLRTGYRRVEWNVELEAGGILTRTPRWEPNSRQSPAG